MSQKTPSARHDSTAINFDPALFPAELLPVKKEKRKKRKQYERTLDPLRTNPQNPTNQNLYLIPLPSIPSFLPSFFLSSLPRKRRKGVQNKKRDQPPDILPLVPRRANMYKTCVLTIEPKSGP